MERHAEELSRGTVELGVAKRTGRKSAALSMPCVVLAAEATNLLVPSPLILTCPCLFLIN